MEAPETTNIDTILEGVVNVVEAKYLVQHLYAQCLEQGVSAANLRATKLVGFDRFKVLR